MLDGGTHLHFGDAPPARVAQPGKLFESRVRDRLWHPSVAMANDPDEEGAARIDLLQTQADRPLAAGLLLGDPPSQIDVDELDTIRRQPLAQLRED